MQHKPVAKRIAAILLLLLVIFGGVNLFWYGFKYLPYKRMAAQMQRSDDSERPRYIYTDGEYLFHLKMPGYLSFQSGFLYIVEKDKEDAASFIADENGNLTEKNIPHVDMFIWPQMFSQPQCRVTIYEETDSVWVMTNNQGEFIPDETLSDTENDRLSVQFEEHKGEIQEMIKAAVAFWGDGLN
ncbi:MAG: hypothetical protein E7426_00430 [Ruminococcaceae bacterium]|nr:hypothetical protein [Oscillospiraceae bacterium]